MNQQAYYEETLIQFLYKVGEMSTLDIEKMFASIDLQLANNVISNRYNETSLIKRGYMKYDDTRQIISITENGRNYIENKFGERR